MTTPLSTPLHPHPIPFTRPAACPHVFVRAEIADADGRTVAYLPEPDGRGGGAESDGAEGQFRATLALFTASPELARLVREVYDGGAKVVNGTWFARAAKALRGIDAASAMARGTTDASASTATDTPGADEPPTTRPIHYHDAGCFERVDGEGGEALWELACGREEPTVARRPL